MRRSLTATGAGPSHVDGRGLDSLSPGQLGEIVQAVWWESRSMREGIHRLRRIHHCDLVVIAADLALGAGARMPERFSSGIGPRPRPRLTIGGDCPCRDLVVDLLTEVDRFLTARGADELINPPGAVRGHLRRRGAADWTRRRRMEMGAQARTDRIRTSVRAGSLPDDFHRALFEYLVDEAGSLAPLEDEAQLHRRLAVLAAAEFGGHAEEYRDRVLSGLVIVEAACRGGPRVRADAAATEERISWWERYIERPLGRRTRLGDEPLDVAVSGDDVGAGREIACPVAEQEFERVLDRIAPSTTATLVRKFSHCGECEDRVRSRR